MRFNLPQKKIHICKFYIFVGVVTVLKVIMMGLFSSDYQNELFIPFISWFVENGGNPYQHFYDLGIENAFPYPCMMLFIQSIGAIIVQIFGIESIFLTNIAYKLPSLLIDLMGLYFLVKLFPEKRRYAAVIYYASPIVFYACYMHGQLDLIPTVLLLGAIYYISSREEYRYIKSGILLVLSLTTKLHILAVLPIIFMYLYKRDGLKKTIIYSITVVTGTVAMLGIFMSSGFTSMVLFNEEQQVLTEMALRFATVEIYVPIIAILMVYFGGWRVKSMNRELFISLCGMLFAVFVAFCSPMPGWYIWIVPYVTLFFVNVSLEKYKNIAIYMLLNALYIVYFMVFHARDMVDLYFLEVDMSFIKVENSLLKNVVFTLLSGTLIYIVYSMYQFGIASNSFYKRKNVPFTLGIAGDSGAGKSTLLEVIETGLGERNLLYIEGDGDHKWERGEKYWEEYTHLNPKANYLYRQAQDLRELRTGNSVRRVEYNHDTGKFTKVKKINPKNYVILCGLHSLYLPQARRCLDLKIYMDVDEKLRRFWKIQRDVAHRGYSKEKIIQQIEERMSDAQKYIYPQKKYADMIIQYYDKTLTDYMVDRHEEKISIKITVSAAIDLEPIIGELSQYGVKVTYDYLDNLQMQTVDIDAGDLENVILPIEKISTRIILQLEEVTRENLNIEDSRNGIIMLFLLLLISKKMEGEV